MTTKMEGLQQSFLVVLFIMLFKVTFVQAGSNF